MGGPADSEFEGFYREAFPRVARFAMTLCLSEDEAFDLTQEAFARTWGAWDRARLADEPALFTMKVAANLAFSSTRRRKRLRTLLPKLASHDGEDSTSRTDTRLMVRAAIRSLPKKERMAVVLSYLGDLRSDQVADILGISPTTVRVHLNHARARLGALLDDGSRE